MESNDKMLSVPAEPTEAMWGSDLVRAIVRWMGEAQPTPARLMLDLRMHGIDMPDWLRREKEMSEVTHVVSKGTRAVILYKVMLKAA